MKFAAVIFGCRDCFEVTEYDKFMEHIQKAVDSLNCVFGPDEETEVGIQEARDIINSRLMSYEDIELAKKYKDADKISLDEMKKRIAIVKKNKRQKAKQS